MMKLFNSEMSDHLRTLCAQRLMNNNWTVVFNQFFDPVCHGCRIHRLHLCREVRLPNECPRYDIKQSDDGEAPVMLELWEMKNTPLLPSFPGSHWPEVIAPDRVLSMGQIELNCVFILN